MSIRTRFAPSPTGLLHLGGARTALFNFLYARNKGGEFVLRIEDTDRERNVPGSVEKLQHALKWLGIEVDEGPSTGGKFGPYIQSQRLNVYREHAQQLLNMEAAYPCFCSRERLLSLRSPSGHTPGYDGHCRRLSERQREEKLRMGLPYTVRLKTPCTGSTTVSDHVYGQVTVQNATIGDRVLLKSDGYPTYHLANVVDDHLMEISHVMRGEEWLLSTALHQLVYSALKWQPPSFVHLPLLLSSSGGKLSKRNQDVFVESYQGKGYLPEAVLNFIALLGWTPSSQQAGKEQAISNNKEPARAHQDIYTLSELVESFSLEGLNKRLVPVDEDKLLWMNKQHFKKKLANNTELESLAETLQYHLKHNTAYSVPSDHPSLSIEYLKKVLLLLEDRISQLTLIPQEASYFWTDPVPDREVILQETFGEDDWTKLVKCLECVRDSLNSFQLSDNKETLNTTLRDSARDCGVPYRDVMLLCRLSITGVKTSPNLLDVMLLLGKDLVLHRLNCTLETL